MKFAYSSLVFSFAIGTVLIILPIGISFSPNDTIEINTTLKTGDFIKTNLYFQTDLTELLPLQVQQIL